MALEMLDKKSANYSDRARAIFGGEMVGWENTLVLVRYGERFREYRRFMHQFIGGRTQVARYTSIMEKATHNFLRHVASDPDRVQTHIRQYVSS